MNESTDSCIQTLTDPETKRSEEWNEQEKPLTKWLTDFQAFELQFNQHIVYRRQNNRTAQDRNRVIGVYADYKNQCMMKEHYSQFTIHDFNVFF